jgi:CHAT domain-containing protein
MQIKGDPFVHELASFYQSASLPKRRALAQARKLMNQANDLAVRSNFEEARKLYSEAKSVFARSGNRWEAAVADYLIGHCYLFTFRIDLSLSVIGPLDRMCKERDYLWLRSQTLNALGSLKDMKSEPSRGIQCTEEALRISERIDDTYSVQKNLVQLADHYKKLGDSDQSLVYLSRCLSHMREAWPGARQAARNYEQVAQVVSRWQLYSAAAEYESEALRVMLESGGGSEDQARTFLPYVHLGVMYGKRGEYEEGIRLVDLGLRIAEEIPAEENDTRHAAYAMLQLAHLHRQAGDYSRAVTLYDGAIERYGKGAEAWLYDARKGRLFCYLAQGNDAAVKGELQAVLELSEANREKILEERNRNTFFDAEQNVYDAAIWFAYLRRGDPRLGFDYSEDSRARSLLDSMSANAQVPRELAEPLNAEQIQARLSDNVQIVQYAALEDRLLIWVVTKDGFSATDVQVPLTDLTRKALDFHRSISRQSPEALDEARKLYDLLIRPVESRLSKDKEICIVPDKALNYVPFNALVSRNSGRYLLQDYPLSFSPSATVHIICSELARTRGVRKDERLLAVGNPRFDRSEYPELDNLPSAAEEADDVAKTYHPFSQSLIGPDAREETIMREMEKADVIHLASHYVVDELSPRYSKLLLAAEQDKSQSPLSSPGVLQAGELEGRSLPMARLVVLSACRSGIERYYNGEGMIGMSRVFMAAGVPQVVASLWQADSIATTEMMVKFHDYRKREGLPAAAALRRAQLDLLNGSRHKRPYFWAAFIAIGGHESTRNVVK